MNNNNIVSVIIPVYKVEKYLKECVESVLEQDYPYLEMILVDDGSPDQCPRLCDEYARKYPNIRVINKKNAGLGAARNSGADIANGAYLLFLDSDDKLDGAGTVRALVEKMEESEADIVVGGFRRLTERGISGVNQFHVPSQDYMQSVDFRFIGFMSGHLSYDWGKLYRKSFLEKNQIRCCTYPFTQDKMHNMQCCVYEPTYVFLEKSVVQYRVNQDSVTFRYKKGYGKIWIRMASDFQKFMRDRKIEKDYGDLIDFHMFIGSFFVAKQELLNPEHGFSWAVRALREYGKHPLTKKAMRELARGKYAMSLHSVYMRIIIIMAAILFQIHGYVIYAAGIALLLKLETRWK